MRCSSARVRRLGPFSSQARSARCRRRLMAGAADDRRDALAELLALVASGEDAGDAIQRGLAYSAQSAGAAFSAIVRQGSVVASHGFRSADVPVVALIDIAAGRSTAFEYGGFHDFECLAVPIEDETDSKL